MLLSVCILAKDAAHCLEKALATAVRLGDEVVVRVDNSSTDKTEEIAFMWSLTAQGVPVRFFTYDFVDFGSARNGLIHEAKGDWIFMLDADEVIDCSDIVKIRRHLAQSPQRAVYSFPRFNWLDLERKSYHQKFYPDRQVRLLPGGGEVNYGDQKVHEVAKGAPAVYFPDSLVHIHHFCFAYRTHDDWHKVNQFYKKLGSQLENVNPYEES